MEPFYRTRDNIGIYLNKSFHQHNFISDDILKQVLFDNESKILDGINQQQEECILTTKMPFEVGASFCIECEQGNPNVYFAKRGERPYLSRMVRGAVPRKTNKVTVIMRLSGKYSYTAITAWAGVPARPELGNIQYFEKCKDPLAAIQESAEFWMNHALIEENPTAEQLLCDLKLISNQRGLTFEELTTSQIVGILSERMGQDLF